MSYPYYTVPSSVDDGGQNLGAVYRLVIKGPGDYKLWARDNDAALDAAWAAFYTTMPEGPRPIDPNDNLPPGITFVLIQRIETMAPGVSIINGTLITTETIGGVSVSIPTPISFIQVGPGVNPPVPPGLTGPGW